MSGLTQPTARGGDVRGVSAVLVVAVPFSFWGATAVCTAVHSAPSPPSHRRRLARRTRPGLGSAAGGLCHGKSCLSGTHGVARQSRTRRSTFTRKVAGGVRLTVFADAVDQERSRPHSD